MMLTETSTRPQADGGLFPSPTPQEYIRGVHSKRYTTGAGILCPNKNEEAKTAASPPQPQRDSRGTRLEEE